MGLLKWFLGYSAAKHLLETTRPQPVNLHLNIEIPLGGEDDEEGRRNTEPEDGLADCFYVRDGDDLPMSFFDADGRRVDANGCPL